MLKKQKGFVASEEQEQAALIDWLKLKNLPYYHTPNGGARNKIEGAKFKRLGVKAGVPDICIPIACNGFHGLYIEMKRRSGSMVSTHQQTWLTLLSNNGYCALVAYGFEHAKRIVEAYISNPEFSREKQENYE